jgi:hypothetical protein
MASSIFEAFIKGPSDIGQAKKMIMVACCLVIFTIILTGGFYIYSMLWGLDGELRSIMEDPTIPITLLVMATCAFFTFKESIIAASILLLNQSLDFLVLLTGASASGVVITIFKFLIYIGAIRAILYIRQAKKSEAISNA